MKDAAYVKSEIAAVLFSLQMNERRTFRDQQQYDNDTKKLEELKKELEFIEFTSDFKEGNTI